MRRPTSGFTEQSQSVVAAVLNGAHIVRVHDVKAAVDAVRGGWMRFVQCE